jgi:hypothetical protein
MMLNTVEREIGARVRNYAKLMVDLSKNEKEKDSNLTTKSIWRSAYFPGQKTKVINPDEIPEPCNQIRYSQSKIALRELIYKKRHVCRQKMADDLMDVSIDWDTNLTPSEVWIPKGRLVAHVHEHTGKFIFTLVLIILN